MGEECRRIPMYIFQRFFNDEAKKNLRSAPAVILFFQEILWHFLKIDEKIGLFGPTFCFYQNNFRFQKNFLKAMKNFLGARFQLFCQKHLHTIFSKNHRKSPKNFFKVLFGKNAKKNLA